MQNLQGYAVFDETGTIIPITLCASWLVTDITDRKVPTEVQESVTRFFDKVAPWCIAGGWKKAEAAGYTVRRVDIAVTEYKG